MWTWITEIFTRLFGGGGGAQIGSRNQSQAISEVTTGDHSPVVAAGRDVHFNVPLSRNDETSGKFADLERQMPDWLDALRQHLANNAFLRDVIVLHTPTIVYNWPDNHLMFSEQEDPKIYNRMKILENYGLVRDLKGNRFAYRLSEDFVKYLTAQKNPP
jgi:hypothetical protein